MPTPGQLPALLMHQPHLHRRPQRRRRQQRPPPPRLQQRRRLYQDPPKRQGLAQHPRRAHNFHLSKAKLTTYSSMKNKPTAQSRPARRSPWLALVSPLRRLGENGYFNLRVLLGLLITLTGVFLALVGFGRFALPAASIAQTQTR